MTAEHMAAAPQPAYRLRRVATWHLFCCSFFNTTRVLQPSAWHWTCQRAAADSERVSLDLSATKYYSSSNCVGEIRFNKSHGGLYALQPARKAGNLTKS